MLSGKSQASTQPTALGSLLQASTYGATIPTIYGMTLSPLLAIWAANIRQGGSVKKFKQLKKGVTAYVENIDFLLGHNPIMGVQQMWNNGAPWPLNFVTQTFSATSGGSGAFTITDAHFYAVIGVTLTQAYAVTFDDYGASGPVTFTGNFEVPLWNEEYIGPDPIDGSAYRYAPYTYRWEPSDGAVVTIDGFPLGLLVDTTVTVHYSQVTSATSFQGPLAHNRLAFEPELGSGTEYSDAGLPSQQIIYPMYAGIGSSDIDLGSGGALPQLQAEVQGKFGVYATGDADFADIIEDVFKSGVAQASIGAGTNAFSAVEHGLSGYDYPGCVQKQVYSSATAGSLSTLSYALPNTAGNFLVIVATSGTTLSISDSAGNSYTPIFSSGLGYQVWYAPVVTSGVNTVTVSGQSTDWQTTILEVAGVDTFDVFAVNGSPITTTVVQGFPEYLLGISLFTAVTNPPDPGLVQWDAIVTNPNFYGNVSPNQNILEQRTKSPGTFSYSDSTADATCILAFKCVNAPTYPTPVGDFIDTASLNLVRLQCRANGLYGSLSMSSQQAASDWLQTLYDAADAAAVFCGFKLFSAPYSEVSFVGNGAIYNAPTAGGPIYNLTTENGDFIPSSNDAPIKLATAARVDQPNVLQMQCVNRTSNYNPSLVEQPDAASISLFGVRKADPITNNAVQDVSIARQLLGIQVKKLQYGGDVYNFKLPAKWCLLAPMGSGNGNVGSSPPFGTTPGLPLPPPGQAVAWVTATIAPVPANGSGLSHLPPPDYFWFATAIGTLTTGTMAASAGFLAFPTASCSWGGFVLPGTIPTASVQHIYPVAVFISNNGQAQQIICSAIPTFNFGPGTAGIGHDILPATGGNLTGVTIDAKVFASLPRPENAGILTVNFVGLAVYYLSATPQPLPSAGARNNADAVITITDPLADINKIPVRITSMTENPDLTLDCVAEPFVYGMYAPSALPTDTPAPFQPNVSTGAGNVNAPVIFEPVPELIASQNVGQLWIVVSSGNANYGGAQVYISTDGGSSYNILGNPLVGSATTGVTTADWPASADPDTTNNLSLDLTECNGSLLSYAVANEDNFVYPCYVSGGGQAIPYELMTYAVATLTGTSLYALQATGGNHLRRGVFAAPLDAIGVDHPANSRFAFLDPTGQGILKVNMDPTWIGQTLHFKIPSYNTFGGAIQSLSSCTVYTYTPIGTSGTGPTQNAYTNSPQFPLTQPTSTTIHLAAVTTTFAAQVSNVVNYSARTFTIPTPSVPVWYYVTILDTAQVGETSATLTATCQTSNALVGVPGNTYMGAILALPAGSATRSLAGGWPAPQTIQVGP